MNVYKGFIQNGLKVETTQIFFSLGKQVKQTMVHPYHGLLLSNKKVWIINTHNDLDESPENDTECQKWQSKYSIFSMIPII